MRKFSLFIAIHFLIFSHVCSQKIVVSDWSEINLSGYTLIPNELDSLAPDLLLKFPVIRSGVIYETNNDKMTIIGQVKDESLIKTILFENEKLYHNSSGIFSSEVALNKGLNEFKIIAMDEHNNYSELKLKINCLKSELDNEVIEIKGKYYGLFMAVNTYNDFRFGDLQNPINDAIALKEVLVSKYTFSEKNILFLKNPTSLDIRTAFDSLSRVLTEEDNLFIFYAGHGYMDAEANTGFWIPSDAQIDSRALWLRNSYLIDLMREIRSKHTLLVTDACFAGSIFTSRSIGDYSSIGISKMYSLPSRKAMTSGNNEEVPDQSAFIKYFIDRLAENEKKYFPADLLFSSFRQAVIHNSDVLPQYSRIKNVGDEGGEFIFIMK